MPPLSEEVFAKLIFNNCGKIEGNIAVAVSGGSDSLSLACLLNRWSLKQKIKLIALTVDHKLRQESTQESKVVADLMSQYDIEHHILTWEIPVHKSLQENARIARYDLLIQECVRQNITNLFLAHHQNDQDETVLERFIKGSYLWGLSGIQPVVKTPYVNIIRPLLTVDKLQLQSTLKEFELKAIEDPSNSNIKFSRVQHREWFSHNSPNIIRKIQEFSQNWRQEASYRLQEMIQKLILLDYEGIIVLSMEKFLTISKPWSIFFLSKLIQHLSGHYYPPRSISIYKLWKHIQIPFRPITCSGCYICFQSGKIYVMRELGDIRHQLPLDGKRSFYHWDRRFDISIKNIGDNLEIRKTPELTREDHPFIPRGVYRYYRQTRPALYNNEKFILDFSSTENEYGIRIKYLPWAFIG